MSKTDTTTRETMESARDVGYDAHTNHGVWPRLDFAELFCSPVKPPLISRDLWATVTAHTYERQPSRFVLAPAFIPPTGVHGHFNSDCKISTAIHLGTVTILKMLPHQLEASESELWRKPRSRPPRAFRRQGGKHETVSRSQTP